MTATTEQSNLIDKARQSLEAARLLAEQGYHQFAASRAYYAMFYVAEALLLGEDIAYSKHSAVIAGFGQVFARTGRIPTTFHRYLIEGQSSRHSADYDADSGLSAEDAQLQIQHAAEFVELGARLLDTTRRGD